VGDAGSNFIGGILKHTYSLATKRWRRGVVLYEALQIDRHHSYLLWMTVRETNNIVRDNEQTLSLVVDCGRAYEAAQLTMVQRYVPFRNNVHVRVRFTYCKGRNPLGELVGN